MTLIINLFGGPGCGKSTTAAGIFSDLKRAGVNAELVSELVTEFAKDKVWEKSNKIFQNQYYIFGKQHWKLFRTLGEVDVVVTDSPLLLSIVYNDLYAKKAAFNAMALEAFNEFNNLNYVLTRTKVYNPKGRNQTEEEACNIDGLTRKMLEDNGVSYTELMYDTAQETIFNTVMQQVEHLVH